MKIKITLLSLLIPLLSFALDWQQEYRQERETLIHGKQLLHK